MKSIHALCYSSSGEKRQHLNYVASQARATLVVVSARAGPTSPTHDDGGTTSASRVEVASSGPERGVYRGVDCDTAQQRVLWGHCQGGLSRTQARRLSRGRYFCDLIAGSCSEVNAPPPAGCRLRPSFAE